MAESHNDIVDILTAEDQPPEWLIPEMVTQGSMVTLVGESGAGKSYVSYTMALAIAAGLKAFTGIIPRGAAKRLVYFDDENSVQDRDKYLRRAWTGICAQNGIKTESSAHLKLLKANFWPLSFQLGHDEWPDVVSMWMSRLRPHSLVFDTANACFNIEDENSNAENGKAIKRIKSLMRQEADEQYPVASAIVLKHAKTRTDKGQVRTVRGAKIWKDQSDSVLFQVKAGGRPRKDGLSLTRLIPDKVRAYGLQRSIYITPRWTDDKRSGLVLDASYTSSRDHKNDERNDEE